MSGTHAFISNDGTLALCCGEWSAIYKDESRHITKIIDKNMEIVRKQDDGSWKFILDNGSADNWVDRMKIQKTLTKGMLMVLGKYKAPNRGFVFRLKFNGLSLGLYWTIIKRPLDNQFSMKNSK